MVVVLVAFLFSANDICIFFFLTLVMSLLSRTAYGLEYRRLPTPTSLDVQTGCRPCLGKLPSTSALHLRTSTAANGIVRYLPAAFTEEEWTNLVALDDKLYVIRFMLSSG